MGLAFGAALAFGFTASFFEVVFFAVDFFTVDFFAAAFFTVFLAAVFFDKGFFAEERAFEAVFWGLLAVFFLAGLLDFVVFAAIAVCFYLTWIFAVILSSE